MRAYQKHLPEIQALGASLVTISPQAPDNSLSTAEKNELTFEVLSDAGNLVARDYGLVMTLAEELRPLYKSFGIDLEATNGDSSFELPVPGAYVIARDGTVKLAFADIDYTRRLEPAAILGALKGLAQ